MLMPVQNPAAVRTSDARSDDRTREVAFSSRSVLIARRVAGIAMRVEVPLSSYRGVALSLGAEPEAGAVHRIELLHRDPDLSILLKETTNSDEIAIEWSAWAETLSLPRLFEPAPMAGDSLDAAAASLPMPRRRGSVVARRRPRFSRRRRMGSQQRLAIAYRAEREIISYE
jgi:hypothetical protein